MVKHLHVKKSKQGKSLSCFCLFQALSRTVHIGRVSTIHLPVKHHLSKDLSHDYHVRSNLSGVGILRQDWPAEGMASLALLVL